MFFCAELGGIATWMIWNILKCKYPHNYIDIDDMSDSKVHGANMEPIWGRQDPVGPYVSPVNFAIWDRKGTI